MEHEQEYYKLHGYGEIDIFHYKQIIFMNF